VSPKDDEVVGITVRNGARNFEYGVWRSRCCGDEIVLYRDSIFPMCNKHRGQVTEWVLVSTDLLSKPNVARVASRSTERLFNSSAHLSSNRLKELSTGGVVSDEIECAHLTACAPCRLVLEQFALEHHRQFLDGSKSA